MSAPRELNHPDDVVILTVDVADSPIAELRLSEIYDVETSTMNDDYLVVLQDYVALQLEATVGLCDRFKFRLLDSCFIPLHCRANGDIISLRKRTMERLIRQTLQSRLDTCSPVSVSILIKFKTPGFRIPQRLNESSRIPPKIGGIARHNNCVITAIETNVEEDAQHACPLLLHHPAGNAPTVGCIPLTDSTTVDNIVALEPGTCVLVQILQTVYPFHVSECPDASDGNEPYDLARTADKSLLAETANKTEAVTFQNDFSDSVNHFSTTLRFCPVVRGIHLFDMSMITTPWSPALVVADSPVCGRTRDTSLGITVQVAAACHPDRHEHFVNAMPAPCASAWLPILLRYQPVDRGRHFLLVLGP